MFRFIFILSLFFSTLVQSSEYLVERHYETLNDLDVWHPSKLRVVAAKALQKSSRGKLNYLLSLYFAKRPIELAFFAKATRFARRQSKALCNVTNGPRHTDDEVDAVRHFLWSSLLTYYLGERSSRAILSLQEYKPPYEISDSTLMDLHNNEEGILYGKHLMNSVSLLVDEGIIKHLIKLEALEVLRNGSLKYLKSTQSACTQ